MLLILDIGGRSSESFSGRFIVGYSCLLVDDYDSRADLAVLTVLAGRSCPGFAEDSYLDHKVTEISGVAATAAAGLGAAVVVG